MDDTISRQAAIDAVCKMHCGCGLYRCPLNYEEDGTEVCADVRMLMELPSAQTEQLDIRPNIVTTWRSDGLYSLICPVCGYRRVVWTNFCPNCGVPNCGVKMRERSENVDN